MSPLAAAPATDGTLSWGITSAICRGLAGAHGKIFGTPTACGSNHTFTVQVTETVEGEPLTGTKELTLTVKEPAGPTINTTELPLAFIGGNYTAQLAATAGSGGTLSWSITSDNSRLADPGCGTGALSGTVPDNAATGPISLTFR